MLDTRDVGGGIKLMKNAAFVFLVGIIFVLTSTFFSTTVQVVGWIVFALLSSAAFVLFIFAIVHPNR